MEVKELDTHRKALAINLEAAIFGSFAEIGAGQEVARWFLTVGGASATVAKSISAYDKEVSDDIYGAGTRYVSEERLCAMLDHEWKELLTQLQHSRGDKTRFFSFVDTVATRNFAGTNIAHGWMGLRFQDQPGGPGNDIILHFNLLDPTSQLEQEATGILGVNLLYAIFHQRTNPGTFVKGIAEVVAPSRLEIDYIELKGPVFESADWERSAMNVRLVTHRFSQGVICTRDKGHVPFIDGFHKKAVVLAPGFFEKPAPYHAEMMTTALQHLRDENHSSEEPLGLFCVTVPPLLPDESNPEFADLLSRVDALHQLGQGVLLVHDRELYKMSAIIQRFTSLPIRFVVGISVLLRVFEDDYRHLNGSTLKAIAMLFPQNVRVYAYPMSTSAVQGWANKLSATEWQWQDANGTVYADSLKPPGALRYLYEYLLASNFIVPVKPSAGAAESVA